MDVVPDTSEEQLWLAELDLLGADDPRIRPVQFAIRTAVRAQALARRAGTDAIDELLDARAAMIGASSRQVFDRAIGYLRLDDRLSREERISAAATQLVAHP